MKQRSLEQMRTAEQWLRRDIRAGMYIRLGYHSKKPWLVRERLTTVQQDGAKLTEFVVENGDTTLCLDIKRLSAQAFPLDRDLWAYEGTVTS